MNTFKSVYGLHLSMLVLNRSDNLNATLPTPDIYVADAQKLASLVMETLQKLCTNEQAQLFYDSVKTKAWHVGTDEPEPCLPQRKKALR